MTTRHITNGLAALLALGLQATESLAQGFSPAAMERQKSERLWMSTNNAAGTAFDDIRNYSDVSAGYDYTGGNFHRPQQGEAEKNINVSSEGFINLKDAYVWGRFSFIQKNTDDAGYNASIADPYRLMPFYVADDHLSDWRNQYYTLQFRAATPLLWQRVAFGLEGTYKAVLAAKQRDPRVDTRFYTLELKPGATVQIGGGHTIGADFEYSSIKEDSRMSTVNAYVDQDYYELYGLGMASKGIGSGRNTNYFGDRVGGSVQYGYARQGFRLLFEAGYSKRVENVEISFTTPKKDAAVKENTLHASGSALVTDGKYTHHITAKYENRDADGIQYMSQRDNSATQSGWVALHHDIRSTYKRQQAAVDYAISRDRGGEYRWKIEAGLRYTSVKDKYLLPVSTKDAEAWGASVAAKYNIELGRKMHRRLLLCLSGGFSDSPSGGYTYGGAHSDYPTVTGLETLETAYLMSGYYRLGAQATYSQQYKEGSKTHLFARIGFSYTKTSDYGYDHRSVAQVSVGVNF